MPTRFTETNKWMDTWFSELSPLGKLVFIYLTENCDNAGFFEVRGKLHPLIIGISRSDYEAALGELSKALEYSKDRGKIWLKNFLRYQRNYPLNAKNNAHKQIIALIKKNAPDFDGRVHGAIAIDGVDENDAPPEPQRGRPKKIKRRTAVEIPNGVNLKPLLDALRCRYSMPTVDLSPFAAAINEAIDAGFSKESVQPTLEWMGAQTAWDYVPGFRSPNQLRDNLPGLYAKSQEGKPAKAPRNEAFEALGNPGRSEDLFDYSTLKIDFDKGKRK